MAKKEVKSGVKKAKKFIAKINLWGERKIRVGDILEEAEVNKEWIKRGFVEELKEGKKDK